MKACKRRLKESQEAYKQESNSLIGSLWNTTQQYGQGAMNIAKRVAVDTTAKAKGGLAQLNDVELLNLGEHTKKFHGFLDQILPALQEDESSSPSPRRHHRDHIQEDASPQARGTATPSLHAEQPNTSSQHSTSSGRSMKELNSEIKQKLINDFDPVYAGFCKHMGLDPKDPKSRDTLQGYARQVLRDSRHQDSPKPKTDADMQKLLMARKLANLEKLEEERKKAEHEQELQALRDQIDKLQQQDSKDKPETEAEELQRLRQAEADRQQKLIELKKKRRKQRIAERKRKERAEAARQKAEAEKAHQAELQKLRDQMQQLQQQPTSPTAEAEEATGWSSVPGVSTIQKVFKLLPERAQQGATWGFTGCGAAGYFLGNIISENYATSTQTWLKYAVGGGCALGGATFGMIAGGIGDCYGYFQPTTGETAKTTAQLEDTLSKTQEDTQRVNQAMVLKIQELQMQLGHIQQGGSTQLDQRDVEDLTDEGEGEFDDYDDSTDESDLDDELF